MANKEEFKAFVRKNPSLINKIKNGEMTWQKYYELYDMYGEEESIWKDYLKKEENTKNLLSTGNLINDFSSFLKSIDLNSLQTGIENVQRVLGVIQDLRKNESVGSTQQEYKPRPIYKHFED